LEEKFKMAAMNRIYVHNTDIFCCTPDNNEIPMAMPMFSGPGNKTVQILSDVWAYSKSEIAKLID